MEDAVCVVDCGAVWSKGSSLDDSSPVACSCRWCVDSGLGVALLGWACRRHEFVVVIKFLRKLLKVDVSGCSWVAR